MLSDNVLTSYGDCCLKMPNIVQCFIANSPSDMTIILSQSRQKVVMNLFSQVKQHMDGNWQITVFI